MVDIASKESIIFLIASSIILLTLFILGFVWMYLVKRGMKVPIIVPMILFPLISVICGLVASLVSDIGIVAMIADIFLSLVIGLVIALSCAYVIYKNKE